MLYILSVYKNGIDFNFLNAGKWLGQQVESNRYRMRFSHEKSLFFDLFSIKKFHLIERQLRAHTSIFLWIYGNTFCENL